MIQDLTKYLTGIAIGIRFRPSFALEDQLGRVIDTVLYRKDSFFNPKVFTKASANVGQRILHNPNTDDKFTIDNSNFIVDFNLSNTHGGFTRADAPKIIEAFRDEILFGAMKKHGIAHVFRIGLVKRFIFPFHDLASKFVESTIGNTLEGVNDIELNFSKKIPVAEALAMRDVHDWANAIFNIVKKANLQEISMSLDYQTYFNPLLPSVDDIKYNPFMAAANSFTEKTFLPWLNKNYAGAIND